VVFHAVVDGVVRGATHPYTADGPSSAAGCIAV